MKELHRSILLFVISLAVLLALIAGYIFLFLDLKDRNQAIITMHQDLLEKEHQQKERLELERTIVTTDADRQTLESYFIPGDKAVSFLETLESYGKLAGTAFEIVTVDINTPAEGTPAVPTEGDTASETAAPVATATKEQPSLSITLHALGRFQDIYRLLLLLENAPYEFEFDGTTMRKFQIMDTQTAETLPKISGIERIDPSSIPFLWDAQFKIKLLTFTPTQTL
jgi:hypothetical protein